MDGWLDVWLGRTDERMAILQEEGILNPYGYLNKL